MSIIQFAAFGQDGCRLGGLEIGPVYLATPRFELGGPPLLGSAKGLEIGPGDLAGRLHDGFALHVRWAMPRMGYLWLQADNGGLTYRLSASPMAQVWNLNYELARSRVLWNSQLEPQALPVNLQLPGRFFDRLRQAATMLHDAMFANQDRRSLLADEALALAIDAGERLAVQIARRTLVTRHAGRSALDRAAASELAATMFLTADPVAGQPAAKVTCANRVNHLPAGLSAEQVEQWRQVFDEGIVTFGPRDLLGGALKEQLAALDFLQRCGATARGRALLPWLDDHGQPAVAVDEEQRRQWRQAAVDLVRRLGDRIGVWELLPPLPHLNLQERHLAQIAATAAAVKEACPQVKLILCPGELFVTRMCDPQDAVRQTTWTTTAQFAPMMNGQVPLAAHRPMPAAALPTPVAPLPTPAAALPMAIDMTSQIPPAPPAPAAPLEAPSATPPTVTAPHSPPDPLRPPLARPLQLLCRLLDDCPAIDSVGLAVYYPGCDLQQLFRTVDVVAQASGRPVHLLMAAAPSLWKEDPTSALGAAAPHFSRELGYWRQPWQPQVQAAYGLGLVMMALAHPAVASIEWCDFSDQLPHDFPFGGLLDAEGRPKPLHAHLAAARESSFQSVDSWDKMLQD